ncbi:hypothetical protein LWT73_24500, partial [Enterobacter hormaechei]|nr:hypothetical protein [Enterobacter hormaechei]
FGSISGIPKRSFARTKRYSPLSTLELFDELVSCDLLTKRNAFGKLEINPIFENHFEWIMSEAFEIVGNHLGYNVPQIRKLMATICQMNLK